MITPVSIITNSISSENVIAYHLPFGRTAYRYAAPGAALRIMYIAALFLLYHKQKVLSNYSFKEFLSFVNSSLFLSSSQNDKILILLKEFLFIFFKLFAFGFFTADTEYR